MSTPYHWWDDPEASLRAGGSPGPTPPPAVDLTALLRAGVTQSLTQSVAAAALVVEVGTSRPQPNPRFVLPLSGQVAGHSVTRTATYDVVPYVVAAGAEFVYDIHVTVEVFGIPQDVGVAVTAYSADYTQVLTLYGSELVTVVPDYSPTAFAFNDGFLTTNVVGSDLSVDEGGNLVSAAGGSYGLSIGISWQASAV